MCSWWRQKKDPEEPADHALGRSRGGFSTKIHLLCDRSGHPLHFHLTAGQQNESTALESVLEGADESIFDQDGEPIAWPLSLAGDKAYRAKWIDEYLILQRNMDWSVSRFKWVLARAVGTLQRSYL